MNIYDIKLEGDTVTLTFNDQTVKTYKEIENPVASVEEAPANPEVAPIETPAEPVEAVETVEAPAEVKEETEEASQ